MRNRILQARAIDLRKRLTDAEQLLWMHLKHRQLNGYRFRRQFPIGTYIADFVCLEAKVIVELDGGQHQQQSAYDARRNAAMEASGFSVMRFWNDQVLVQTSEVLESVLLALRQRCPSPRIRPHPNPPPLRRGGD